MGGHLLSRWWLELSIPCRQDCSLPQPTRRRNLNLIEKTFYNTIFHNFAKSSFSCWKSNPSGSVLTLFRTHGVNKQAWASSHLERTHCQLACCKAPQVTAYIEVSSYLGQKRA